MISERLFGEPLSAGLGKRLGIPFLRAQLEQIELKVQDKLIHLDQSGLGVVGISTVVWDCGLYLVDYLMYKCEVDGFELGSCLDLGCGTGICGLASLLLGATKCTFSDKHVTACLTSNIEQLPPDVLSRTQVAEFDWTNDDVCLDLVSEKWDTILCSDILYEHRLHNSILALLRQLTFRMLILSYKRRHDLEEKTFFSKLESEYDVELVDKDSFRLVNMASNDAVGIYILCISMKPRPP